MPAQGRGARGSLAAPLGGCPLSSPQLDELPGWSSMTLWESLSAKRGREVVSKGPVPGPVHLPSSPGLGKDAWYRWGESASRQPETRDPWGVFLEKLMEQSGVDRDPSMQEGKGKGRGPPLKCHIILRQLERAANRQARWAGFLFGRQRVRAPDKALAHPEA